jgi:hypothetical protein
MFQLIVSVIAIALIAALAIASLYYGGNAFSGSTSKAQVTALVNQAQQISGGAALYKTDNAGTPIDAIADLTPDYLQAIPTPPQVAQGSSWLVTTDGAYAYISVPAANIATVCAEVTKQNGNVAAVTGAPFSATAVTALGAQFNCEGDATATAFVFKL